MVLNLTNIIIKLLMIENLVFSGAGVKIYSLVGFIKCLDENDLLKNIKSVIGTSSGSLIATLIVLNLKYSEIEEKEEAPQSRQGRKII